MLEHFCHETSQKQCMCTCKMHEATKLGVVRHNSESYSLPTATKFIHRVTVHPMIEFYCRTAHCGPLHASQMLQTRPFGFLTSHTSMDLQYNNNLYLQFCSHGFVLFSNVDSLHLGTHTSHAFQSQFCGSHTLTGHKILDHWKNF